jgi:hypothetical protein
MPRDHKAEYGYQPTWEKQREKQEEHAENRGERLHGELIDIEELEDEN